MPSVNIEYSNRAAKRHKGLKGYVSHWVNGDGDEENDQSVKIEWEDPPAETKCY